MLDVIVVGFWISKSRNYEIRFYSWSAAISYMETDDAKEFSALFSDPISSNNRLTFSVTVPSA